MDDAENRDIAATNKKNVQSIFDSGARKTYKVVWGAIIAGTIVGLVSATLLNFLGLGLSTFHREGDSGLLTFGIGAVVWLFVSGILSSLLCGWFAGVFSNTSCKFERGCHGILSGGLALLMTILLATTGAGTVVGGVVGLIEHSPVQVKSKMTAAVSKNLPEYTNGDKSHNSSSENNISDTKDVINTVGVSSLIIFAVIFLSCLANILGAVVCRTTNRPDERD